jgi:hypothetical protein
VTAQRIVRPEPERLEPNREWPSLLGAAAPDPAGRDLAVGYRVLEEYLRNGVRSAREHETSDPARPEPLIERIARASSDFGAVWLELVRALLSSTGTAPHGAGVDPGPFRMPVEPPTPAASLGQAVPVKDGLRLRVRSLLPVEVSLRWLQDSLDGALVAHELRGQAGAPAITGVQAEQQDGALVLSLCVPDTQPAGCYSGLIVSAASNLPQAMLVAHVLSEE